jgi:hypothetical protein
VAGVTGDGASGSPLRVCFELITEGDLVSPDGWPSCMSPPTPGEPIAAYWDRVISRNPFLQAVLARAAGLKAPSLGWMRPADHTFEWWAKTWSEAEMPSVPSWVFATARKEAMNRHIKRIYWRLVVEWRGQILAGDLVMKGYRDDVSELPLEKVEPRLLLNSFMALRPRSPGGIGFYPEQWHGQQPPSLRRYRELTLWPAETAEAPKPPPPAKPPKKRFSRTSRAAEAERCSASL